MKLTLKFKLEEEDVAGLEKALESMLLKLKDFGNDIREIHEELNEDDWAICGFYDTIDYELEI